MNIFFHGLEQPNLQTIIKDYDLPWDIFSLKTDTFEDFNRIEKDPELIVFTIFKGKTIKEFNLESFRRKFPKSKLFCLSNSFCLFVAEDLAQNGFDGFGILDAVKKDNFLASIEKLKTGEKHFPKLGFKTIEGFSIKELITIRHIAAGLSVKQVAYLWNSSQDAIKERKKYIKSKLSVHTTEEISVWAALRMNIPKQDELLTKGEWLFKFFK